MSINAYNPSNYSLEYLDSVKQSMQNADANGDKTISMDELNQNTQAAYAGIFAGNSELTTKAGNIIDAQAELFAKFAGDDAILDENEYAAALNSAENAELLDEYWDLRDEQAKQQAQETRKSAFYGVEEEKNNFFTSDSDYLKSAQEALEQLNYDSTAHLDAEEFYQDISNSYENFFSGNREILDEALDITKSQAGIYGEFADDECILSAEDYADALDLDNNQIFSNSYNLLEDEYAS